MNTVYLLWFEKEEEDTELLIGVYSSESAAQAAIGRLKGKRGFADFPDGFHIHAHQLDQDGWTEGYFVDHIPEAP